MIVHAALSHLSSTTFKRCRCLNINPPPVWAVRAVVVFVIFYKKRKSTLNKNVNF